MKTIIFLLLGIILFSFDKPNEKIEIPYEILNSIKSGDSKQLASFFNSNVELIILNKEDVYSKVQAELIIKDFFLRYRPYNFTLLYQGGKIGAQYAIGNLSTNSNVFRVYFLLKMNNGDPYIHQLRIEKE